VANGRMSTGTSINNTFATTFTGAVLRVPVNTDSGYATVSEFSRSNH
jgi:hypothetical protein